MKVKVVFIRGSLDIARNTSIDKLRSKNFNNSQKNLSSDNFVNLLDDSNKLVNRIDTIGIQEFVKKLKPKCIEIIDLLFFKGYTQQEASRRIGHSHWGLSKRKTETVLTI